MSIYSGFATRFQEQAYDHCIDSLLYVLQKRIIRFYTNQHTDQEKFISVVLKLIHQMKKMQKNKYLQPKSSESLSQLTKFMQIHQQTIIAGNIPPLVQTVVQPVKIPQPIPQPVQQPKVEKKKSIYWVQRIMKDQASKELKEEGERTKTRSAEKRSIDKKSIDRGSLQREDNSKEKKAVAFRRTNFQNNSIRGVKLKQTSRTNLSRQGSTSKRLEKSRTNSNYLTQKSQLNAEYVQGLNSGIDKEGISVVRKFTNVSSNPQQVKPAATRGEAEDIIKEYIVKMKKFKKSSRSRNNRSEMFGRVNDF